jgi:tetratricopeptide (TPR) repeat protein
MSLQPTILYCGLIENIKEPINDIFQLINYLENNGDYLDRINSLIEICLEKKIYEACLKIGNILYKRKKYKEMLEWWNKGIQYNIYECYHNIAVYYEDINDTNMMIKYYNEAIKYNIHQSFTNLALYYYDNHNYHKMLVMLNEGIKLNSSHCLNNMAIYYIGINKHQAKKFYEKAIQLSDNPVIKINYARLLFLLNDTNYKIYLEKGLEIGDIDAIEMLNIILDNHFDSLLAIKYYRFLNNKHSEKLLSLIKQ